MKGKISKIKNTKGELALPVTTVEAVYLEDGKTKLSDEIKDVLKYEEFDDESITAEIPDVIEKINGIEKDISEINSSLETKASNVSLAQLENKLNSFETEQDLNQNKDIELVSMRTSIDGFVFETSSKRVDEIEVKNNKAYDAVFNRKVISKDIIGNYENKYISVTGEELSSDDWRLYNYFIEVVGGTQLTYFGRLVNAIGGFGLYDKNKKFIKIISADNHGVSIGCKQITLPNECKYIKYCFCTVGITQDIIDTLPKKITLTVEYPYELNNCVKELFNENKNIVQIYYPTSFENLNQYQNSSGEFVSSDNWTRNKTLVDIVGGNYYLYKGALLGQTAGMCFYDKDENIVGFLTSPNNGTTINDVVSSVEFLAPIGATKMSFCYFKSEITSLSDIGIFSIIKEIDYDNPKIKEVFAEQEYDICIVGGGAGGIGSAYALKNSGLRVCLIEKDNMLGGTHTNAWINVHATTPPPPFLKELTLEMLKTPYLHYVDKDYQKIINQDDILYKDTFLRLQHRTDGREACICFEPIAMAKKYYTDLKPTIDIKLNTEVIDVKLEDNKITSIITNKNEAINSKLFIDCTANNKLISLSGIELLSGEESKTFFQSEYGFTENNAPVNDNYDACNYPTLMYRVTGGTEDLSDITAKWTNDALAYLNKEENKIYLNTVSYLGGNGQLARDREDYLYDILKARTLEHWKTIKYGESPRFATLDLPSKKYDKIAPKLGIRETYRIRAERMLNENDLYVKISSENIKDGDNLDKKIACGNHIADFHGTTNVNVHAINTNLKPYGVPYGCLIPKGLSNVFVASRGSGLTHIGASTFRLNKDIMQLGWASGKACEIFVLDELVDIRDVNVDKLQKEEFTDFENTVKELETIMK